MWSMLAGAAESVHDAEYAMGWELYGRRAIRQGDWKLLWEPKPFGSQSWALYNLTKDINEKKDLSKENPEKASELKALWEAYKNENSVLLGNSGNCSVQPLYIDREMPHAKATTNAARVAR